MTLKQKLDQNDLFTLFFSFFFFELIRKMISWRNQDGTGYLPRVKIFKLNFYKNCF